MRVEDKVRSNWSCGYIAEKYLYLIGAWSFPFRSMVWILSVSGIWFVVWMLLVRPSEHQLSELLQRHIVATRERERLADIRGRTERLQSAIRRQRDMVEEMQNRELKHTTLFKKLAQFADRAGLEIVATDGGREGELAGLQVSVEGAFRGVLFLLRDMAADEEIPMPSLYVLRAAPDTPSPPRVRFDYTLSSVRVLSDVKVE